ncbi:TerD family protein, partial [Nocardia carnea]|uniref:TerD family protein n=1 Tax=Nocardia carnea TaxID=37328 RepID=UPI0024552382
RNAFIRVVDRSTGAELARYDLSEVASTETAMVFGELYRHGAEWKFRAIGAGRAGRWAHPGGQHRCRRRLRGRG